MLPMRTISVRVFRWEPSYLRAIHPWAYEMLIGKSRILSHFEYCRRGTSGGPRGQADLDRMGDSIDPAHPDTRWRIRRLCDFDQFGEERAFLAGRIHPRVRLLGEIFVNALERKQIRLQIEERLGSKA